MNSPKRPTSTKPPSGSAHRPAGGRPAAARPGAKPATAQTRKPAEPLNDAELARLQDLLDALPAPLEPLDVSMLDGYLMGVLLQPKAVPLADWWPWVLDSEGRALPASHDTRELLALVQRRHRELNLAIVDRQWFDPWVFELEEDAEPSEVVLPWVAGFALATEHFPALMEQDAAELLEPLAQLYMHLDPDDLEDADDLLEEIETLEPPESVEEAVECLVRASLLLADISRPQKQAATPARRPPARRGPPPRGRY